MPKGSAPRYLQTVRKPDRALTPLPAWAVADLCRLGQSVPCEDYRLWTGQP